MFPSLNNRTNHPNIVIIGPESSFRIQAFQSDMKKLGLSPATVIGYNEVLQNPETLAQHLTPRSLLRFESPDIQSESLQPLFEAGAEASREAGFLTLDRSEISEFLIDNGRILPPAQLFFGLSVAMQTAVSQSNPLNCQPTADPGDVATAMDKTACQEYLNSNNIPTPTFLGNITDFDQLLENMKAQKIRSAFIKLRHGSAAAGMIALITSPTGRIAAYTTAVRGRGDKIYSTRRIQKLETHREIATLIKDLSPMGLHAEEWTPKAGFRDKNCDLRVIIIAGEPVFTVLRQSRHPMTNLHLGGQRACAHKLKERMKPEHWSALEQTCRNIAKAFPRSLMLGADIAVKKDFCNHVVLEVNGFGDFIKDVTHQGYTPHQWQIRQYQQWGANT